MTKGHPEAAGGCIASNTGAQRTSKKLEEQLTAATERAEVAEARLIDHTSSPPAEVMRLKAALQKE